jgi:predicted transcriptional regulator
MTKHTSGISDNQHQDIEEFLHLFADVEKALKFRLKRRVNDPAGIRRLIDEYSERNSYWTDAANRLRNLADIRNLLTHQRGAGGYPIAVAPASVESIREIGKSLLQPEPVSTKFKRDVKSVAPNDTLASVLPAAFKHGFSQFPVIEGGRFIGMITENEIIRWLGHRAQSNSAKIDLDAVTVRMVLKEKDPFLRGIPIFCFESLEAAVEEVISRFAAEPALEVVLLTGSGGKDRPIEGIITQWDAARYYR